MNLFSFTGNLGRDAELRAAGQSQVAKFSVGVKAGYGEKATTLWINCELWGKQAESLVGYLLKGKQVGITGELSQRSWAKADGTPQTSLDLRVGTVTLLGGAESRSEPRHPSAPAVDDDLPF